MDKQTYRLQVVIQERAKRLATRCGCTVDIALQYLKATNYCPNAAFLNFVRDREASIKAQPERSAHNPTISERIRALTAGGFIAGQNGMLSSTGMNQDFIDAVFEEQQDFSRIYGKPERSHTGNVYGPVFSMFCGL